MNSLRRFSIMVGLVCASPYAQAQSAPGKAADKPAQKPPASPTAPAPAAPGAAPTPATTPDAAAAPAPIAIPAPPVAPPPSGSGLARAGGGVAYVSTARNVGAELVRSYEACKSAGKCVALEGKAAIEAYAATMKTAASKAAHIYDCANPTSACFESYWRRQGVDIDGLIAESPNSQDLLKALGLSREVNGSEVLFAAVGGLQQFLIDRAKAESMNYTAGQLKGRLCKEHEAYLKETCALLKTEDLAFDEATLLKFKKALVADFNALPSIVFQQLPEAKTPDDAAFRVFFKGAIDALFETANGRQPKQLPRRWAELNRKAYGTLATKLDCKLGAAAMPAACWALLMPEMATAAVDMVESGGTRVDWTPENLAKAIERGSVQFCKVYSSSKPDNAACLLDAPDQFQALVANFRALAEASVRFAELQTAVANMVKQGLPPVEIAARVLPDYADAFEQWGRAFEKVRPSGLGGPDALTFERIAVSLRASGAIASHDYPTLIGVVANAVEPGGPFATLQLPKKVVDSLGFAARIASSRKPEDAKQAFEDYAAPLGTYKVKYDREEFTWAINAFVGPFVGHGMRLKHVNNVESDLAFRPVSAPLGVDWTFASSPSWHLGLMLGVIDPFAAGTIDSDAKAADLDWGAIFTPGLSLRLGIGGSPFTLLAGGVYQPFAKASESCTDGSGSVKPCWEGQLQLGAALAVDVPILMLK